jgi:hypothetical protein
MADVEMGRHRVTVLRPADSSASSPTIALEIPGINREQVELLRQLVGPNLGAGFVLAVDGEVVARGAGTAVPAVDPALAQVQRLTEMAVQQHEYLCAEMRRIRDEYEQDHAEERAILRTLRQRWMARVCDDQVRGEDALRYVVEAARSMVKKEEPPASGGA